MGAKAFRLQGGASALMLLPVACLLVSIVDLGYWIYISTIRGYWFSQSVGYLVMLCSFCGQPSHTPEVASCLVSVWVFVYILCLGGFLCFLCFVWLLSEKLHWRELVGIVLLIFTSSIWHTQLYSNQNFDDVMLAGLPRFITPSDSTVHLSIPFWVLGGISVLIPLCSKYLAKAFVPVLCAVAGIIFTWSLMFHDENYIDEMRMVRLCFRRQLEGSA